MWRCTGKYRIYTWTSQSHPFSLISPLLTTNQRKGFSNIAAIKTPTYPTHVFLLPVFCSSCAPAWRPIHRLQPHIDTCYSYSRLLLPEVAGGYNGFPEYADNAVCVCVRGFWFFFNALCENCHWKGLRLNMSSRRQSRARQWSRRWFMG